MNKKEKILFASIIICLISSACLNAYFIKIDRLEKNEEKDCKCNEGKIVDSKVFDIPLIVASQEEEEENKNIYIMKIYHDTLYEWEYMGTITMNQPYKHEEYFTIEIEEIYREGDRWFIKKVKTEHGEFDVLSWEEYKKEYEKRIDGDYSGDLDAE